MLATSSRLSRGTLFNFTATLLLGLATTTASHAQAYPTATRTPIQAGVAFSFASPGTNSNSSNGLVVQTPYIQGVTAFGDIGLTQRIGLEVTFHDLNLITPQDFGQTTILAGPRFSIALEDRANIYLKALGGIGRFNYQSPSYTPHSDSYAVAAFGGGIEFRLSRHINLRPIDAEYQIWPGYPTGTLKPFITSIGAAYRF